MTAIWECDFFVMSSFSLQGVPHSHFQLCMERRVEGLSHLLERFPSTVVEALCSGSETPRWCSEGAFLLLTQIIGYS